MEQVQSRIKIDIGIANCVYLFQKNFFLPTNADTQKMLFLFVFRVCFVDQLVFFCTKHTKPLQNAIRCSLCFAIFVQFVFCGKKFAYHFSRRAF
jgi:hypothetical protein